MLEATVVSDPRAADELLDRCCLHDDFRAREELVTRYMSMARRLASRYRNSGEPQDDLEQVAYVGLLKAIDRYDPALGSFERFAVPNVLGELKRHFRDKGWTMRIPRSLQTRFLAVQGATDVLTTKLGRSPHPRDIAQHTGFSVEEVLEALDAGTAYTPAALDAPIGHDPDGQRTLMDTLGCEDERYELFDAGDAIAPAFRALPEREREILRLRFTEDLTQAEIAALVGVSQMHVSRLLRRALGRLTAAAQAA